MPSTTSPHGQAIVTADVPPGCGTPCVTQAKEAEVCFVLEGKLLLHPPTEGHHQHAGDMAHLPPLTPHGDRNPSDRPACFLAWTVGRPMDRFFVRMAGHGVARVV